MSLETLKLQVAASVHAELAVEDLPDIVPYRGSIDSTTLGVWTLSLEYGYFIGGEYLSLSLVRSQPASRGMANNVQFAGRIVAKGSDGAALAQQSMILTVEEDYGVQFPRYMAWEVAVSAGNDLRICIDIEPAELSLPGAKLVPKTSSLTSQTLRSLLRGEDVLDTKFILFSRGLPPSSFRDGYGATKPQAVFANSELLSSVSDYFQTLLTGSFADSNDQSFGEGSQEYTQEYDYPSDSDLDSDSGSEDELDNGEDASNGTGNKARKGEEAASFSKVDDRAKPSTGNPLKIGKVVHVKDTAHRTWSALIFYLYTSEISFAPLTSSSHRNGHRPPNREPSAKSMYRLSDKLGLEDLAALSLEHIKSQITPENVVEELFSHFTSRYPAIRDMELAVALSNWETVKTSTALQETITLVVSEERPHARDALLALLAGLAGRQ